MSHILMIPIHVDALYLQSDLIVPEARADFTRLPYTANNRDNNSDTAFVSEEIISQPFEDLNLRLKPGIHLHWSLPDALTLWEARSGCDRFSARP